ncbi:MAG TPA: fluoride efflux transporter CrcB [Solirubrobacteraceae bacterium]|nr:fluoride efflux transporter CrcB [Solirubrobacteraceae bacterium]
MSAWVWIAAALLGGIGASARFVLDTLIAGRVRGDFPLGTLTVNASGALLLGLVTGLAVEGNLLVLAGTATLGSYTTFSTWMLESQRLVEDAEVPSAIANVVLSLLIGVGAVALGRTVGGLL